jgi:receptor protein-tyrosine kinase
MTHSPRAHLVERAAEMLARRVPRPEEAPPPAAPPVAPQMVPPAAAPSAIVHSPPRPAPAIALGALRVAGLLAGQPDGHRVREEIAMVQHALLRQVDDALPDASPQRRIILIASALPGEGRSFLALNLAHAIAGRGARPVLLVDADGRPGSLTALLGLGDRPGLRELVAAPSGRSTDFVLPTEAERLAFLASGRPLPEAPAAPRGTVAHALQRLAMALPDHVLIVDSPPCLSSSEATALAGVAGQVLLVVAAERTTRAEVEAALDAVEACPVLRLVLNGARLGAHGAPHAAQPAEAPEPAHA